jgi:hypothetical protein
MFKTVALSAVILSTAAATALAGGGKWVREGNTAIIDGPTKYTKAVQLIKDPAIEYPDPDSYALVAFLPSGPAKSKLRLHQIMNLSVAYAVQSGMSAGGSPRISIVLDVNRDGQYDSTNDEVVFVSLGSDPLGSDDVGAYVVSGNLTDRDGVWTTGSSSVVLGSFDEVLAQSKNGRPLADGAVDAVFTIVDFAGNEEPLSIAVAAMQINKNKLNPKLKITDVTDRSAQ